MTLECSRPIPSGVVPGTPSASLFFKLSPLASGDVGSRRYEGGLNALYCYWQIQCTISSRMQAADNPEVMTGFLLLM